MSEEKQIGTLLGLDLILSPEHYKEINDLKQENKQLKEENERLKDMVNEPNIEIDKDLLITRGNLIHWLDRTPTEDDKDLCDYLATAVKNQYQYKKKIDNLKSILTELEEWLKKEIKQLERNIKFEREQAFFIQYHIYCHCINKIQELKEKYK